MTDKEYTETLKKVNQKDKELSKKGRKLDRIEADCGLSLAGSVMDGLGGKKLTVTKSKGGVVHFYEIRIDRISTSVSQFAKYYIQQLDSNNHIERYLMVGQRVLEKLVKHWGYLKEDENREDYTTLEIGQWNECLYNKTANKLLCEEI